MSGLIDTHNRRINYLRISITDRCNLRCRYCMPKEGVSQFGHSEILSYEEILRVAALAVKRGINKIRITGGEPLVRKGVVSLVERLAGLAGVNDLSMTTNALLLREFAPELHRAGLRRVNISMDSLDPQKYRQITRGGDLRKVWEGIDAARRVGMSPIKINVVAIAGFNDGEIEDFARLTQKEPFQVRFIEFMPIGEASEWKPEQCISCQRDQGAGRKNRPPPPPDRSGERARGACPPVQVSRGRGRDRVYQPGERTLLPVLQPTPPHRRWKGQDLSLLRGADRLESLSCARAPARRNWTRKLDEALLSKPAHHGPLGGVMKRCHLPMVKIGG